MFDFYWQTINLYREEMIRADTSKDLYARLDAGMDWAKFLYETGLMSRDVYNLAYEVFYNAFILKDTLMQIERTRCSRQPDMS